MAVSEKNRLLCLRLPNIPPTKKQLSDSNPMARYPWNKAYELLGVFFCSSNSLNLYHSSIIAFPWNEKMAVIFLKGSQLRYLSPSLRSIGSLIAKAFLRIQKIKSNLLIQSTPGVFCTHYYQNESSGFLSFDNVDFVSKQPRFLQKLNLIPDEIFFYNLGDPSQFPNAYFHIIRQIYLP